MGTKFKVENEGKKALKYVFAYFCRKTRSNLLLFYNLVQMSLFGINFIIIITTTIISFNNIFTHQRIILQAFMTNISCSTALRDIDRM